MSDTELAEQIELIELSQAYKFENIPPEDQEILITFNDKVVLTSQEMLMLSGLPKSNKSTINIMLLFSFITGKSIHGMSVKQTGKALFIDTEMTNLSFYNAFNRSRKLSGVKNESINYDLFDIYLFRILDQVEIMRKIEFILFRKEYKYLFIDGLLDLVNNFNDVEETKHLIFWLQKITEVFNISIITVLHLSRSNLYSMGHLGSSMERKSFSSIIIKSDSKKNNKIIDISPHFMRGDSHFKDISIDLDD